MLRGYFLRVLRTKKAVFVLRKGRREERGAWKENGRGRQRAWKRKEMERQEREWKGQAESMKAEGKGEVGEDYGAHYNGWTWTTGNDNG